MNILSTTKENNHSQKILILVQEKLGFSVSSSIRNFINHFFKFSVYNKYQSNVDEINQDISLRYLFTTYNIDKDTVSSTLIKNEYTLNARDLSLTNPNKVIYSNDKPFTINFYKESVGNNFIPKDLRDSNNNVYFVHKSYVKGVLCTVTNSYDKQNNPADLIELKIYYNYAISNSMVDSLFEEYNSFIKNNYLFIENSNN